MPRWIGSRWIGLRTPVVLGLAALAALVAVALAIGNVFTPAQAPQGADGDAAARPFSELLAQGERIDAIEIEGPDARTRLRRSEAGGWRVAEVDGYPARDARVARLLEAITEIRVVERRPQSPDRLGELGLTRDSEGADWRRIAIETADGRALTRLMVGRTESIPGAIGATYVRNLDTDSVWLADIGFEIPARPLDWVDREILALPREAILEVRTAPLEGEPLHIRRPEPDALSFRPVGTSAEVEMETAWMVGELPSVFGHVVVEDIAKAEATNEASDPSGLVRLNNGIRLRFTIQREDGAPWVQFTVDPAPEATSPTKDSPAKDGAEAAGNDAQSPENGTGEAAESAQRLPSLADLQRLESWRFRVGEATAERLTRSLAELQAPSSSEAPGGQDAAPETSDAKPQTR